MSAPSAETIKAKLSAVDATQETIVSVAQWVMFYKRNAAQIVDIWHQAVRDASSNRKLNLIYLANEVAQTSRAKKRPEYPEALSKVMPDALEHVFRQSTTSIQEKLKRVVDVWRQRSVFSPQVIDEISQRLQTRRKSPVAAKNNAQSVPAELEALSLAYRRITSATAAASLSASTAKHIYDSVMTDGLPANPGVLQTKLRQLQNALEAAKTGSANLVAIREQVARELDVLAAANQSGLDALRSQLEALAQQSTAVMVRATEIDNAAALYPEQTSTTPEMEPPQAEALTPSEKEFDLDTVMKSITGAQNKDLPGSAGDPVSKMDLDETMLELMSRGNSTAAPQTAPEEDEYVP
ncbi:RNA polymerase II-binding domain-domain-containing protein [Protomyces lactucae-debilis]|uniref:RNA polymerase II-binding domain-domain-containing protein n=1 Tax=Protomyces lactucae-debilis TaxID=2754530 RepID=A0A1Y2FM86_PROLT|nr:RNA polymerase II-binding domain-containing protein [Protomyces lactucae-debilis]ORY85091.1 RNA polymerase II-binding domain-domain-containing protein [Protomyces lactucae-debilis]